MSKHSRYSFKDKRVLITGASGGLGSALARSFAESGARLIVSSRSMKALDELISLFPDDTEAIALTADLSSPGQARMLAKKALKEVGRIDVLINNAGLGYFALMEETIEENIRYLFEVNTFSPLALAKALIPSMKLYGSGRIINIVSAAGHTPIPTAGVYGGAKAALAVMANTMRLELEPFGIDVVNIYPGTISSSFEENALREEKRPGICPKDSCGLPKWKVAEQVMKAASGPPGEIWLEKEGRFLSVANLIWPGYVDRKLSKVRDRVIKTKSLKERIWRLVQIEPAIGCNLECLMCPWKDVREQAEHDGIMTEDIWNAVRPHLDQIRSIDFTGGGEPFMQPKLIDWISEASSRGCETGVLNNGTLVTRDITKALLATGINWICFSLDGADTETYEKIRVGADFDMVCGNIANLTSSRSGSKPKVMINFVLLPDNFHQIEDIIRLASKLGVDQVNFKQCDVIRGKHGLGLGLFADKETKETNRRLKELTAARKLARKLKIDTTAFAFTPKEKPVCDQDPRDELFIRYDGLVSPCINLSYGGPTTFLGRKIIMPSVHYGRLPHDDLAELWAANETAAQYRDVFKARQEAFDKIYIQSLTGGSMPNTEKIQAEAEEKMPRAMEGCQICHYLYGI